MFICMVFFLFTLECFLFVCFLAFWGGFVVVFFVFLRHNIHFINTVFMNICFV